MQHLYRKLCIRSICMWKSLKNWWCLKSLNMATFLIIRILLPTYLKSSKILKYYSLPPPHTYTRTCTQITLTILINYSYSISQFSIAQYFIIKNGFLILNLIWSTGFLKFPFVSFWVYFWFLSMKGSSFFWLRNSTVNEIANRLVHSSSYLWQVTFSSLFFDYTTNQVEIIIWSPRESEGPLKF